jgi:hypothetical protein
MDVVESPPAVVFPFERVGQALEDHCPMPLGAGKPISGAFKRNTCQPEGL